jgi:hypothetical protein
MALRSPAPIGGEYSGDMSKPSDAESKEYFERAKGVGDGPVGYFRNSNFVPGARWHPAMIGRDKGHPGKLRVPLLAIILITIVVGAIVGTLIALNLQ